MLLSLYVLLALVAIVALGYYRAPVWAWSLVFLAWLFLVGAPRPVLIAYVAIAGIFNATPVRTLLVSRPVGGLLGRLGIFPKISETERVALEAGNTWVDAELFSGRPDLKKMFAETFPEITPDERAFLDGPVEELCAMMDDWRAHCDHDLSPEVWAFLKKNGFFGLIVPKRFGGKEMSAQGVSAVVHKVASRSFPLSVTVMIPNSLGPAELLSHYGTDAQKNEYLPKLADGRHIPCFGLTEPGAGSDAGSMSAEGVLFRGPDGRPMIRLNFEKRYISLASVATLMGLAFKMKDPENLLGKGMDLGITCALIPTETAGLELGRRHDPLGVPFYNCPITGKDVVCSLEQVIGGEGGVGRGWEMLMACLAAGRGVALPASSVAAAKLASRVAGAYSAVRHQFAMPIGKFEGIEEPLARLGGMTYLMEAMRQYTCGALAAGKKPAVVSAIVKYNATELVRELVNDAMDIVAGAGISRGPKNLLASIYQAMPIGITVEGANILTRTMIIFGQGAIRCHPFAYQEMRAVERGDWKTFDRAFWGHVGLFVSNGCRALVLSTTRARFVPIPVSGPAARYARRILWGSATFAFLADLMMLSLGGDLKRREKLTGRMADILSWLYLATATVRRFEVEGRRPEDVDLLRFSCDTAMVRMQEAFDGVFANFPVPWVGGFLRTVGLGWSRFRTLGHPPADAVGGRIASLLRTPSADRDRLTAGIYMPKNPTDALPRLEAAMTALVAASGVLGRIKEAMKQKLLPKGRPEDALDPAVAAGVITADDAARVRDAAKLRDEAVAVDSFAIEDFDRSTPRPGITPPPLARV